MPSPCYDSNQNVEVTSLVSEATHYVSLAHATTVTLTFTYSSGTIGTITVSPNDSGAPTINQTAHSITFAVANDEEYLVTVNYTPSTAAHIEETPSKKPYFKPTSATC